MINFFDCLTSVKACFPNDSELPTILRRCGFVPIDTWKTWADPYGIKVFFNAANKKIRIRSHSKFLSRNDLYEKIDPNEFFYKSSKILLLYVENSLYLWMYGLDGVIRTFKLKEEYWERVSSLILGFVPVRLFLKLKTNNAEWIFLSLPIDKENGAAFTSHLEIKTS